MKDRTTRAARGWRPLMKVSGLAAFLLYAVLATVAHASTVLVTDTTLVTGTESSVFSFDVSGPGTVSVQLTNLDWPQALSSLSFMAATPNQVLSPWSPPGPTSAQSLVFQVPEGGRYFADVMAVAGGPLDLGAYSLSLSFTPVTAPVPLPSSGALLLGGVAGVIAWLRLRSTRAQSGAPIAAHFAS